MFSCFYTIAHKGRYIHARYNEALAREEFTLNGESHVYASLTAAKQAVARPSVYIQRRGDGILETVDEFKSRKEAKAMLNEYRLADPSGEYYLSSRACRGWTK